MTSSTGPSWTSTIPATLKKWWWLLAIPALIGAVLGYVGGSGGPRTATSLLRINTSATEGQVLTRLAETSVLQSSTLSVFDTAAKARKESSADLRSRSRVTNLPDSLVISIEVTAPTADKAAGDANALAEAAISASTQQLSRDITASTAQTKQLIASGVVTPKEAEEARLAQLGQLLAQRQDDLTRRGTQLTTIQPATAAAATGSSKMSFALMGLAGGLLLGLALALLLGSRRGSVSSVRQARSLYPAADVTTISGVPRSLASLRGRVDRVAVAGNADAASTAAVVQAAQEAGLEPTVMPLSRLAIRQAARDERTVVVIPTDSSTKVADLDAVSDAWGERALVAVAD